MFYFFYHFIYNNINNLLKKIKDVRNNEICSIVFYKKEYT